MVPLAIVGVDEASDLLLQLPRGRVVLQLHSVFHRAMVALDLALRHHKSTWGFREVGRPAGVLHAKAPEKPAQLAGHVAWPIVQKHPRPIPDTLPVELGTRQGPLERFLDVRARHRGGVPSQDVA